MVCILYVCTYHVVERLLVMAGLTHIINIRLRVRHMVLALLGQHRVQHLMQRNMIVKRI